MPITAREQRCFAAALAARKRHRDDQIRELLQQRRWWRAARTWVDGLSPPLIDYTALPSPLTGELTHLWQAAAVIVDDLPLEPTLDLLTEWIALLYSPTRCEQLSVRACFEEMMAKRVEANRGWYEGDPDAPHFQFRDPVLSLIALLSKELGLYR